MINIGKVLWFGGFNKKKGSENNYGFINNGLEDIFVHKRNIKCKIEDIREGSIVTFKIEINPKNSKKQAIEVNILNNINSKDEITQCFYESNKDFWEYFIPLFKKHYNIDEVITIIKNKLNGLQKNHVDYLLSKMPNEFLIDTELLQLLPPKKKFFVLIEIFECTKSTIIDDNFIINEFKDCISKLDKFILSSFIEKLPAQIKAIPDIISLLPALDQANIAFNKLLSSNYEIWDYIVREAKLFCLYRATKENIRLPLFSKIKDDDPIVSFAMLILNAHNKSKEEKIEFFKKGHELFQNYIVGIAWESTEMINLAPFLPSCNKPNVLHCEARLWPDKENKDLEDSNMRAFCPRLYVPVGIKPNISKKYSLDCAHIYPIQSNSWKEWTLIELLDYVGIIPNVDGLINPVEYVNKLSGWINRLNDIRDRLKCSKCGTIMKPNYSYAKFLARYNATVVSCIVESEGHDKNIYLNHCWACSKIIDSRESKFRYMDYYICIHCGSGPQNSNTFTQGDICPACGTAKMAFDFYEKNKKMYCKKCRHSIKLPGERYITGKNRERIVKYIQGQYQYK
jgi:cold shock CspA family protein